MGITDGDISGVRNKIVRGQLLARQKKEKAQNKLAKRIARKEAENRGETVERGWTRTIENTKEWLGDDEKYADPRTRPAKVEVDEETGDVRVDLGTLATLFPPSTSDWDPNSGTLPPLEPKILITTSPGKPPSLLSKDFLTDLQALWGGKGRADIVPRRSPKFELGKVARWARGRGYGAIAVVGEDHSKPSKFTYASPSLPLLLIITLSFTATLTLSLLPNGPTAHLRLTGVTLCREIKVRSCLLLFCLPRRSSPLCTTAGSREINISPSRARPESLLHSARSFPRLASLSSLPTTVFRRITLCPRLRRSPSCSRSELSRFRLPPSLPIHVHAQSCESEFRVEKEGRIREARYSRRRRR